MIINVLFLKSVMSFKIEISRPSMQWKEMQFGKESYFRNLWLIFDLKNSNNIILLTPILAHIYFCYVSLCGKYLIVFSPFLQNIMLFIMGSDITISNIFWFQYRNLDLIVLQSCKAPALWQILSFCVFSFFIVFEPLCKANSIRFYFCI